MDNIKHLDEAQLVQQIKKGNELAFAEVINRYSKQVARVVIGVLGDTPEADDVGQETFIRFWNSVADYRHEAKVSTFLTRIAINLSINELHKRKRQLALSNSFKTANENINEYQYIDERNQVDENEHITKALAALNSDYRTVVVLRMVQGYSTKETAEILEVPIGTVLSRLSRALEKLKIELKKLEIA